ncbi:hypothetical protein AHAS_Ahas02G0108600 [Arachis hypogaea]
MVRSGIKPDRIVFMAVLSACSHAGLVDEGLRYFRLLTRFYNVAPDQEIYGCVVDLLGRAGRVKEAYQLIENIPFKPDECIWVALLGACKAHKQPSNWTGVACLRKLMRGIKNKKEAGMSWIELKNQVYSFVVGGEFVSSNEQIVEVLEIALYMTKKMRFEHKPYAVHSSSFGSILAISINLFIRNRKESGILHVLAERVASISLENTNQQKINWKKSRDARIIYWKREDKSRKMWNLSNSKQNENCFLSCIAKLLTSQGPKLYKCYRLKRKANNGNEFCMRFICIQSDELFCMLQAVTRIKPYICTMPLRMDDRLNQIQLNLADFTKRAYGTNYMETLRVQVHANCCLRRIYFSDRLYSEEELPPEFKLYLLMQVRQCGFSVGYFSGGLEPSVGVSF